MTSFIDTLSFLAPAAVVSDVSVIGIGATVGLFLALAIVSRFGKSS